MWLVHICQPRLCNHLQNVGATTYKNFLQLYAKSACKKQYSAKFVFHNVLLSLPVCSRMFSYTISYEVRFFNIQFWGFEAELYAKHINNYILIVHS